MALQLFLMMKQNSGSFTNLTLSSQFTNCSGSRGQFQHKANGFGSIQPEAFESCFEKMQDKYDV